MEDAPELTTEWRVERADAEGPGLGPFTEIASGTQRTCRAAFEREVESLDSTDEWAEVRLYDGNTLVAEAHTHRPKDLP